MMKFLLDGSTLPQRATRGMMVWTVVRQAFRSSCHADDHCRHL